MIILTVDLILIPVKLIDCFCVRKVRRRNKHCVLSELSDKELERCDMEIDDDEEMCAVRHLLY